RAIHESGPAISARLDGDAEYESAVSEGASTRGCSCQQCSSKSNGGTHSYHKNIYHGTEQPVLETLTPLLAGRTHQLPQKVHFRKAPTCKSAPVFSKSPEYRALIPRSEEHTSELQSRENL